MNNSFTKTQKMVGTGVLAAVVIVLQLLSSFGLHIGPVPISLVLIPIAIGAIIYGPLAGAFLGGVFGAVVIGMILGGLDPASMLMMQYNAPATVITCLGKGILAGLVCGLVYKAFKAAKKGTLGAIIGTLLCPVVNTGIYVLMVCFVFKGLMEDAYKISGVGAVFTALMGMITVNVISEIVITVVLTPVVLQIIKIVTKASRAN
jgi:uncharacterized membrane protein